MNISPRERTLVGVTLAVLLSAILVFAYDGQMKKLNMARNSLNSKQKELTYRKMLVGQRGAIEARFAELKDLMPVFPPDKRVDTHWLGIMDAAASQNGMSISRRQPGAEKLDGDVYELPIECREFEGSLESVVRFLYDVQNEGVMLDIRSLTVRPSPQNPALLRGQFTLYCAYMRE